MKKGKIISGIKELKTTKRNVDKEKMNMLRN
jgi:hypothetical protein